MKFRSNCLAAAALLMIAPTVLFGQFNPYAPAPLRNPDPRARRALREQAVGYAGIEARAFVETHGDVAALAILSCSQHVAQMLVEFHSDGRLGKLPRPCDLLLAIARPKCGDDVALWAMAHAGELADLDHFDAFCSDPLSYALELRQLSADAAALKERRTYGPLGAVVAWVKDWRSAAFWLGCIGVIALVVWRRNRRRAEQPIGV
jgi:hypothetical protein